MYACRPTTKSSRAKHAVKVVYMENDPVFVSLTLLTLRFSIGILSTPVSRLRPLAEDEPTLALLCSVGTAPGTMRSRFAFPSLNWL